MNERREEQPWKKIWKENVCSTEVFVFMIYQLQRTKKHFNVFQLARREIYGLNKMLFLFRRENGFFPLFLAVILHTHTFFLPGATFRQELAKLDNQTADKDRVSFQRNDTQLLLNLLFMIK